MIDRRVVVAFVITRLDVGGAQQTVLELCRRLDRDRFRVLVVAGADPGSGGTVVPEMIATGTELHIIPELVSAVRPLSDLRAVGRLAALFRHERPAIVHTHSSKAGVVGRVAAGVAGTPAVVHTVHGWSFHERMPAALASIFRRLERRLARRSDALVVVADADRRTGLASRIGSPDQYICIRSGVDLRAAASGDRASARVRLGLPLTAGPVIGFVGRLAPQKDPRGLLDAFALVRARTGSTAALVLVGDGPLRPELEAKAAAMGVTSSVLFAGARSDVAQVLPAFDVMVLPSRWEGMPRVLIEAAAAGVPIVATPVGGVTDFVEDGVTGVLAPPGNADALAGAVLRVIDDGALRARMCAQARARADAFSVEEMVTATERLYERLLSGDRMGVPA